MAAFITLKQFCERYAVSERAALVMIHSGELPAITLATSGKKSGKPRWRIRESDLEAFETARSNEKPKAPEVRPVVRKKPESSVGVVFFRNGKRVSQ